MDSCIHTLAQKLSSIQGHEVQGFIKELSSNRLTAAMSGVMIGDIVSVPNPVRQIYGTIVQVCNGEATISPFEPTDGVGIGDTVKLLSRGLSIRPELIKFGDVVDAFGSAGGPLTSTGVSPFATLCTSKRRTSVSERIFTGIRAIDCFTPIGKGQRIAIAAEPGVGKTTLLSSIARHTTIPHIVLALIGERGREATELFTHLLDETTRKKTIAVVSTSDDSALKRMTAAHTATHIAEHLREQGKDVLLLVDSVTRYCRAYREFAFGAGEQAAYRGLPATLFSDLPRLLERPGATDKGSITAIYTLLLPGAGESDPIAEETYSLLDGQILLSSQLAQRGQRPAVNIITSLSRLECRLLDEEMFKAVTLIRHLTATLERDRDLVIFGGTPDTTLRAAIQIEPLVTQFLTQAMSEPSSYEEAQSELLKIHNTAIKLLA